jgi:hypothetical protein
MKIIPALFITLTIFGCLSCSEKTTGTSVNKPPDSSSVQTSSKTDSVETVSRFIVSFYSIGTGSEGAQVTKFEKFIADNGIKINKVIEYERVPWGREGEVDFCLKLSEFSLAGQEKFITEAKAVLADAKRVHFSENSVCRQPRKRPSHQ